MALRGDGLRSLGWRTSDRNGAALATDPDPNSNATLTALATLAALTRDRGGLRSGDRGRLGNASTDRGRIVPTCKRRCC